MPMYKLTIVLPLLELEAFNFHYYPFTHISYIFVFFSFSCKSQNIWADLAVYNKYTRIYVGTLTSYLS